MIGNGSICHLFNGKKRIWGPQVWWHFVHHTAAVGISSTTRAVAVLTRTLAMPTSSLQSRHISDVWTRQQNMPGKEYLCQESYLYDFKVIQISRDLLEGHGEWAHIWWHLMVLRLWRSSNYRLFEPKRSYELVSFRLSSSFVWSADSHDRIISICQTTASTAADALLAYKHVDSKKVAPVRA